MGLLESLNREVVFMPGLPGSGKSFAVANLIKRGSERGFKVVVIDRDRGLAKAIKEVIGTVPDNLEYFLADKWEVYAKALDYAFEHLGHEDWLVFEMAGGMWDSAQDEFARIVYGEDTTEHLLALRAAAEQQADSANRKQDYSKRLASVSYNGMEGRIDWPLVKRMHNAQIFDAAILQGDFNILTTTSLSPLSEEESGRWPMWVGLGSRPEGEKHQQHRHDTILVASQKNGHYYWSTDLGGGNGKDRGGRELIKDFPCDGEGALCAYLDFVEVEATA